MPESKKNRNIRGPAWQRCCKTFLLLLIILTFASAVQAVSAGEIRVGQNTYETIAEAMEYTATDGTIIVSSGDYNENIVIDRPLQLIGVDSGGGKPKIITDSGEAGITINADGTVIEGFSITGDSDCAILINADDTVIADNEILKTPVGITLYSSAGTTISGNSIKGHRIGLFIDESMGCDIYLNNFENTINAKSLSPSVRWSTASLIYIYNNENFTSELGNYWNDYYGTDTEKNGIGDIPYDPYAAEAGAFNPQNQLFINSLNLQNLASGGSSYWQNLFYASNYVKDEYPLMESNSMYSPVAPAGTDTGTLQPQTPQRPGGNLPGVPQGPYADAWWNTQSPFEIVFIMLLISGVTSGIIGFAGGLGSLKAAKEARKGEIFFFEAGFFALALALLYTALSYTSRLVYRNVEFGYIQVVFILMTAFLITSLGFTGVGFFRSRIPVLIIRILPYAAAATAVMFFISIYTAPVELGPITSLAYPSALFLSVLLPLLFSRLFGDREEIWDTKNEKQEAYTGPQDPDSTVVFPSEGMIMGTSLGSSYFPDSLNERYQDVEFIGKGGISRVFKAKRRTDGHVVAVKVPINFDEVTGRLFMKEMRIWEDLSHPNIVKLYSVNILPVPFVEMEYVKNALSGLDMPLLQKNALEVICGIAKGLSYAHSMHIIHRDIKPQNILVTEDFTPKITDWGLGKIMGDGNETTTIGFSLNYAAPEQIAPKKFGSPDERTDIYQMGILFYEILTGKKPFSGVGVAEMSDDILNTRPALPSEFSQDYSEYDDIIMKMLNKHPDDRYRSVDDIIRDLDDIRDNSGH